MLFYENIMCRCMSGPRCSLGGKVSGDEVIPVVPGHECRYKQLPLLGTNEFNLPAGWREEPLGTNFFMPKTLQVCSMEHDNDMNCKS